MRRIIEKIQLYSRYVAASLLALLLSLTVLDVFLQYAFLIYIPGVFDVSKLLLSLIVLFAFVGYVREVVLRLGSVK